MHKVSRRVLFLSLLLLIFIVVAVAITARDIKNHPTIVRPRGTVLLVGDYDGFNSNFNNIQAAINAASPGDYIIIAPGYYTEGTPSNQIVINKPNLHLVGLNENSVIIGAYQLTPKPGSNPCYQTQAQSQNLQNQNGVVIESTGVSIENLTVCNFSGSNSAQSGAQIEITNLRQASTPIYTNITDVNLTSNFLTGVKQQPEPLSNFGINVQGNVDLKVKGSVLSNFAASGLNLSNCTRCHLSVDDLQFLNSFSGIILKNVNGNFTINNSTFLNNFSGIDTFDVNGKLNNKNYCNSSKKTGVKVTQNSGCTQIGDNSFTFLQPYTGTSVTNYNQNFNQNLYDDFNLAGEFPNLPYGVGISVLGSEGFNIIDNSFKQTDSWATVTADILVPATSNLCTDSVNIANADCILKSNDIYISDNKVDLTQNPFMNIIPIEDLGAGLPNNRICIKSNYLDGHELENLCNISNVNLFSNDGLILSCISNYNCSPETLNITAAKLKLFGTALGQNINGLDSSSISQIVESKFSQTTVKPIIAAVTNNLNVCQNIPANRWC